MSSSPQSSSSSSSTTTTSTSPSSTSTKLTSAASSQRFSSQVCVITGGAQGIGFGIAEQLIREDAANVILLDVSLSTLKEATETLNKKYQRNACSYYQVNVRDHNGVQKVFDDIAHAFNGRIDVLIQSAGVTGKTNIKTHEVDLDDFENVMGVNVTGIFNCCKSVLPFMLKRNYGRIVNIASIAGKEGNAGMLAYSTSKAAVIGLTKTIGKDYAHTGITCNAVAPAVIRTAMVAAMPDVQVQYMTSKIPMGRCGTIEEISSLVAFVASPEASFTTGFTFDATGGRATY